MPKREDEVILIDKVKIGWKEYKIKLLESQQTLKTGTGECYGEIFYDEKVIHINKAYDVEFQEATLIHEVLHGIEDMYNLELGEETVTRLAQAIYTVLKDNNLEIRNSKM